MKPELISMTRGSIPMISPLERPLGEARKPARSSKLNVTTIYEAVPDGMAAKRFSDRLAAELGPGCELNLNLWNFQVLGIREIQNIAASAAVTADVVIFSLSGTDVLPPQVEEWIEMWTWLLDDRRPSVVVPFATPDAGGIQIPATLHSSLSSRGLDFIAGLNPEPPQKKFFDDGSRGRRNKRPGPRKSIRQGQVQRIS